MSRPIEEIEAALAHGEEIDNAGVYGGDIRMAAFLAGIDWARAHHPSAAPPQIQIMEAWYEQPTD